MNLTIQQKSIYLILYNATMIMRSVGKKLDKKQQKDFTFRVFEEFSNLSYKMDNELLNESEIIGSIDKLQFDFNSISFGQAQKPINVLLKYHFYLSNSQSKRNEIILHCPIDSIILNKLGVKTSLTNIDKQIYLDLQNRIEHPKIKFDQNWDEKHLRDRDLRIFKL